jgi:hypothetical protein
VGVGARALAAHRPQGPAPCRRTAPRSPLVLALASVGTPSRPQARLEADPPSHRASVDADEAARASEEEAADRAAADRLLGTLGRRARARDPLHRGRAPRRLDDEAARNAPARHRLLRQSHREPQVGRRSGPERPRLPVPRLHRDAPRHRVQARTRVHGRVEGAAGRPDRDRPPAPAGTPSPSSPPATTRWSNRTASRAARRFSVSASTHARRSASARSP